MSQSSPRNQKKQLLRCPSKWVLFTIIQISQENMCWSLFLIKFHAATLLKKRLEHSCFPVKFAGFPRTTFFTEDLRWLLLNQINPKRLFHTKYQMLNPNFSFPTNIRSKSQKLPHSSAIFDFYTTLGTSENQRFSDVFRGYGNWATGKNQLILRKCH